MCEPAHSIVQFDTRECPYSGEPFGGIHHARIGPYVMIHQPGMGHSEAMDNANIVSPALWKYLPPPLYWEGYWWEGDTILYDGSIERYASCGIDFHDAKAAAYEFNKRTVMKDIRTLRNFIEQSMMTSDRREYYSSRVSINMLVLASSGILEEKLRRIRQTYRTQEQYRTMQTSATVGMLRNKKNVKKKFHYLWERGEEPMIAQSV